MMKEIGSWGAGCNAQGCPHLVPPGSGVEPVFQSTKSCKSIDLACPHPSREGNGPAIAGRQTSMTFQRNLAILATLALTGCSGMPNISLPAVADRNNYVGKPLSALTARLGNPTFTRTISGQKTYSWRLGTGIQQCLISVVMAGDIIESYNTSGDSPICGPYEARQESSGSE
jgi:hypothetical protein